MQKIQISMQEVQLKDVALKVQMLGQTFISFEVGFLFSFFSVGTGMIDLVSS